MFPFVNAVNGRSRGLEISPDWKPLSSWRLSGSYSYLSLSLHNKPEFTNMVFVNNYLRISPRHQVRLQSRMDLPHRLELDQTYRYVGELGLWKLPAYHELDARVGWKPHAVLELSVIGQNLFDAHHPEFGTVPVEIRRNAYVQVTVRK
jgi:iron complex outermembrane receptor protein